MSENNTPDWALLQILPVQPGWQAVYASPEKGKACDYVPLIGWALIECAAESFVTALVVPKTTEYSFSHARPQFVQSEKSGFLGYDYPGCHVDWEGLADLHREVCWNEDTYEWTL